MQEAYSLGKYILNHNIVKERNTKQVISIKSQRKNTQKHQMLSATAEFYSPAAG